MSRRKIFVVAFIAGVIVGGSVYPAYRFWNHLEEWCVMKIESTPPPVGGW
jgi:hypothetical protein